MIIDKVVARKIEKRMVRVDKAYEKTSSLCTLRRGRLMRTMESLNRRHMALEVGGVR